MSAKEFFQIFQMTERIQRLRMQALVHRRIAVAARKRSRRLALIYLSTIGLDSRPSIPIKRAVSYGNQMPHLPEDVFQARFHISQDSFVFLLGKLSIHLARKESLIPVWKQILMSLHILTTENSLGTVGQMFGIDESTAVRIFKEFCREIQQNLQEDYMKFYPPSEQAILKVREEFESGLGLPQVYGAVDFFRIGVQNPEKPSSGIRILAATDFRGRFTYVETAFTGNKTDLFDNSPLRDYHRCNKLFYKMSTKLGDTLVPVYLAGNSHFHLQSFIMTPYQHETLNPVQENFNRILEKAQSSVGRTFSQLKQRFPRIVKCRDIQEDVLPNFVRATYILHNVLLERNDLFRSAGIETKGVHRSRNNFDEDGMGMQIRDAVANHILGRMLQR
ncbi:hypothetical protein DMENIID0001_077170 [Sergentomyia squamirostris]